MKTYYRNADGHTYYFKDGELFGAPTFQDGTYDEEAEIAVDDFAEPLTNAEREEITDHLLAINLNA